MPTQTIIPTMLYYTRMRAGEQPGKVAGADSTGGAHGLGQLHSFKAPHPARHLFPNWIIIAPKTMTARPIHVAAGTCSLKANRPNSTLTAAKTAT